MKPTVFKRFSSHMIKICLILETLKLIFLFTWNIRFFPDALIHKVSFQEKQ